MPQLRKSPKDFSNGCTHTNWESSVFSFRNSKAGRHKVIRLKKLGKGGCVNARG
jgi:hypothetical protein